MPARVVDAVAVGQGAQSHDDVAPCGARLQRHEPVGQVGEVPGAGAGSGAFPVDEHQPVAHDDVPGRQVVVYHQVVPVGGDGADPDRVLRRSPAVERVVQLAHNPPDDAGLQGRVVRPGRVRHPAWDVLEDVPTGVVYAEAAHPTRTTPAVTTDARLMRRRLDQAFMSASRLIDTPDDSPASHSASSVEA
jgi:hypothetical protein